CGAHILSVGNPLIWWLGTVAVLVTLVLAVARRDGRAWAALSGILAGYVPWLFFSDRTIFTFYTVAFAPWLMLCLAYVMSVLIGSAEADRERRLAGGLFVGSLLVLIVLVSAFFWPVWTGQVLDIEQWRYRMWLPSWTCAGKCSPGRARPGALLGGGACAGCQHVGQQLPQSGCGLLAHGRLALTLLGRVHGEQGVAGREQRGLARLGRADGGEDAEGAGVRETLSDLALGRVELSDRGGHGLPGLRPGDLVGVDVTGHPLDGGGRRGHGEAMEAVGGDELLEHAPVGLQMQHEPRGLLRDPPGDVHD